MTSALPALLETESRESDAAFIPHVVAWNLTKRCNLACSHCYISAGPAERADGELDPAACRRIVDELLAVNPSPMLILSGGEPLLREDLPQLASYAAGKGATVVVGTNGTLLTDERIRMLKASGVSGVAVSVDSLRAGCHDTFRGRGHALERTTEAVTRLREHRLDVVVQTTATTGNEPEIPALIAWAAVQGAVCFNLYFVVPTGRGEALEPLPPERGEALLAELAQAERRYRGTMMVRAKCAPQFIRHVHQADPDSPVLNYRTRCPCGIDYCRITPDGHLTPCPYNPAPAGDLRRQSFGDIWRDAPLFAGLRARDLGGKCGRCEYRQICGGCRARAFAVTGDHLAADPACAYEPAGDRPVIERRATTYGAPARPALAWSADATARMNRIPSFVRGVVVQRVEAWAKERGLAVITPEHLSEIRRAMPIDFSRRLPFFLRDGADD